VSNKKGPTDVGSENNVDTGNHGWRKVDCWACRRECLWGPGRDGDKREIDTSKSLRGRAGAVEWLAADGSRAVGKKNRAGLEGGRVFVRR